VIAFVARQLGAPASDLGFYEWSGSTIEYHRAQIRAQFRREQIEPLTPGRVLRMVRSALRTAEQNWALRRCRRRSLGGLLARSWKALIVIEGQRVTWCVGGRPPALCRTFCSRPR
jgi:hypothetical protein